MARERERESYREIKKGRVDGGGEDGAKARAKRGR